MNHLLLTDSPSTSSSSSPIDSDNAFREDLGSFDSYNNPYDNGSWNWLTDLFNGGKRNQYDRNYEKYLADSQYQRMFKDLEAAGINPYLLLQNGFGSPGNYSYQLGKNEDGKDALKNIILTLMMVARVAGAFAG